MTSVVDDQPPEEARRLEAFLGEWLVEGTLRSGQSTSAISGLWRFERAIDGWGLVGRMQTDIEGVGSFEEHELIGFGANDQCVHMCSANRYAIRDISVRGPARISLRSDMRAPKKVERCPRRSRSISRHPVGSPPGSSRRPMAAT
jgi:hypothetical protein